MMCVEAYKGVNKRELDLRKRLKQVQKLEAMCWKQWMKKPSAMKQAFKWSKEGHSLKVQIRYEELKNPLLVKKLGISNSFIKTFNNNYKASQK